MMTREEYLLQRSLGTLPKHCPYFIHSCGAFLKENECTQDDDAVYCPDCLGVITIKDAR